MGKVIGISTREKPRAEMVVFAAAKISFAQGVGDDSRGRKRNDRQITIMSVEDWRDVCEELGAKLHWTTRRANILVEGINLKNTMGKFLKIGNFFVEITGELKPCNRMDEQYNGLTQALTPNWRGGVRCRLISEGKVEENDRVVFVEKSRFS